MPTSITTLHEVGLVKHFSKSDPKAQEKGKDINMVAINCHRRLLFLIVSKISEFDEINISFCCSTSG